MPAIGGSDPAADLVARARVELGFSRLLEQPRPVAPPPRFGSSSGYPVWYRVIQLEKFHTGEEIQVSLSFIYRWDVRPGPCRQTGNRPRTTVVGVHHPAVGRIHRRDGLLERVQPLPVHRTRAAIPNKVYIIGH